VRPLHRRIDVGILEALHRVDFGEQPLVSGGCAAPLSRSPR
jgi:hypothetical protein